MVRKVPQQNTKCTKLCRNHMIVFCPILSTLNPPWPPPPCKWKKSCLPLCFSLLNKTLHTFIPIIIFSSTLSYMATKDKAPLLFLTLGRHPLPKEAKSLHFFSYTSLHNKILHTFSYHFQTLHHFK